MTDSEANDAAETLVRAFKEATTIMLKHIPNVAWSFEAFGMQVEAMTAPWPKRAWLRWRAFVLTQQAEGRWLPNERLLWNEDQVWR